MKKKFVFAVLVKLLSPMKFFGQEDNKSINMIITVDDEVIVGSVLRPSLVIHEKDTQKYTVDVQHIQGNYCEFIMWIEESSEKYFHPYQAKNILMK